jgi:hypothetical protein
VIPSGDKKGSYSRSSIKKGKNSQSSVIPSGDKKAKDDNNNYHPINAKTADSSVIPSGDKKGRYHKISRGKYLWFCSVIPSGDKKGRKVYYLR